MLRFRSDATGALPRADRLPSGAAHPFGPTGIGHGLARRSDKLLVIGIAADIVGVAGYLDHGFVVFGKRAAWPTLQMPA